MSYACWIGLQTIKQLKTVVSPTTVWHSVGVFWIEKWINVCYLNVLNPSHVHPGLGLVRFEFHSLLVALVEENKTDCGQCHIFRPSDSHFLPPKEQQQVLQCGLIPTESTCKNHWKSNFPNHIRRWFRKHVTMLLMFPDHTGQPSSAWAEICVFLCVSDEKCNSSLWGESKYWCPTVCCTQTWERWCMHCFIFIYEVERRSLTTSGHWRQIWRQTHDTDACVTAISLSVSLDKL